MLCEWFNDDVINIEKKISSIDTFKNVNLKKYYKPYNNILSSVKKSNNIFDYFIFRKKIK
jgi:hypothetical protein